MSVRKIKDFNITKVARGTTFVLDTNVLYFVHSGYATPNNQKSVAYSNLIKSILKNNYSIEVSALNAQELLHLIEKKEYRLFCERNALDPSSYSLKSYRQNKAQRGLVKSKIDSALSELSSVYILRDGIITIGTLNQFSSDFNLHTMDPIDYTLAKQYNIATTIFISDDKDFQSIPSLQVIAM